MDERADRSQIAELPLHRLKRSRPPGARTARGLPPMAMSSCVIDATETESAKRPMPPQFPHAARSARALTAWNSERKIGWLRRGRSEIGRRFVAVTGGQARESENSRDKQPLSIDIDGARSRPAKLRVMSPRPAAHRGLASRRMADAGVRANQHRIYWEKRRVIQRARRRSNDWPPAASENIRWAFWPLGLSLGARDQLAGAADANESAI